MIAISPNTGATEVVLDAEGKVFKPMPAAFYSDPTLPGFTVALTRWSLTEAERAAVAAGEDIFVAQLVQGDVMQPVDVTVGPDRYVVVPVSEGNPDPASDAEGVE